MQQMVVSVSRQDLCCWDAVSGQLIRRETEFTSETISAYCLDANASHVYFGTENGTILVNNFSNMMRVGQRFRVPGKSEVLQMVSCEKAGGIVFVCVDGTIFHMVDSDCDDDIVRGNWQSHEIILDEAHHRYKASSSCTGNSDTTKPRHSSQKLSISTSMRRSQTQKHSMESSATTSDPSGVPTSALGPELLAKGVSMIPQTQQLLVLQSNNCVSTWTWLKGSWKRTVQYQNKPKNLDCTYMTRMGHFEGLIVSDAANTLFAWTMPGKTAKFTMWKMVQWTAYQPDASSFATIVTGIAFCDIAKTVYVSDDSGWVVSYDLEEAVDKFFHPIGLEGSTYGIGGGGSGVDIEPEFSAFGTTKAHQNGGSMSSQVPVVGPPRVLSYWRAHDGCVTFISILSYPAVLVTCGLDSNIKLWSLGGSLISQFTRVALPNVKFTFNPIAMTIREYDDVIRTVESDGDDDDDDDDTTTISALPQPSATLGRYLGVETTAAHSQVNMAGAPTSSPVVSHQNSLHSNQTTADHRNVSFATQNTHNLHFHNAAFAVPKHQSESQAFLQKLESSVLFARESHRKERKARELEVAHLAEAHKALQQKQRNGFGPLPKIHVPRAKLNVHDPNESDDRHIMSQKTKEMISVAKSMSAYRLDDPDLPRHSPYHQTQNSAVKTTIDGRVVGGVSMEQVLYGDREQWNDFMQNVRNGFQSEQKKLIMPLRKKLEALKEMNNDNKKKLSLRTAGTRSTEEPEQHLRRRQRH
eukprot:PhM_4_TR2068/c1_g1_i2/m.99790